MKVTNTKSFGAVIGLLLMCGGIGTSILGASMTITAAAGARQSLIGMGASLGSSNDFSRMNPDSLRDIENLIWSNEKGLGFRVLRCWSATDQIANGTAMLAAYKACQDSILKVQPNMIFLYASTGPANNVSISTNYPGGLNGYAAHHAQVIADCKAAGFVFQYAQTGNEPNCGQIYPSDSAAALVKYFRTQLDSRGLQSVKIVAPSAASVDATGMSYIQNIKNDATALADLGAFDSHSYNMSFTPQYYDLCNVPGKESWMTESSDNGPETFTDSARASAQAARVCNEMNQGCNVWLYFIAYLGYDPNDNATRIMGYDATTYAHQCFLKYYYFKQERLGFKDGCVFRSSTSNDTRESRYTTMTLTYGDRPAIVGAAGRNTDGTWGITVSNVTGIPDDANDNWQPAATYDITYHVDELASAGAVNFTQYRTSGSLRIANQGTVTMTGGDVHFTIGPMQLVTLVSGSNTKVAEPSGESLHRALKNMNFTSTGRVTFSVAGSSRATVPVELVAYDTHGAKVAMLVRQNMLPGMHSVSLTDARLPAGMYVLSLAWGADRQFIKVAVR
jgi:hypothetical protein